MFKFYSINQNSQIKLATRRPEPFITDIEEIDNNKRRAEEEERDKVRKRKEKKNKEYLDRPFAVRVGDPNAHTSKLNAPPLQFHVVHKTLPGYGKDEKGQTYAHELKKALDHPNSGYRKVTLSVDQYSHDPKLVALVKKHSGKPGLEAYEPIEKNTTATDPAKLELAQAYAHGKAIKSLRERVSDVPYLNKSEFGPDMLSVIATHGGKAAIKLGYTDQTPYIAQNNEDENLCRCARGVDKHVSKIEAKSHYEATGVHLEIHDFMPQADEINVKDSPLMSINNGKEHNGTAHLGTALSQLMSQRDKNAGKTPSNREFMPSVRVGLKSILFKRITGYDTLKGPDGRKIQNPNPINVQSDNLCDNCIEGKLNPEQRDRKCHCSDCMVGRVNIKIEKDEDGNLLYRPYSVGLGSGRQKYLNKSDVPSCPDDCENGYKPSKDKTATDDKIPCSTCNATGKQQNVYGDDAIGFPCGNCNSEDSSITTTPNNVCPKCDKGSIGTRIKKKLSGYKFTFVTKKYEGNPIFLTEFSTAGHANTNIPAWKGHGDKDCTRCGGDDDYQTNNSMPCNCRMAKYSHPDHDCMTDDEHAQHHQSPSNARYIFKSHIDIPEHIYQRAMFKAFQEKPFANPHIRTEMVNSIDSKTNLTPFEQYPGLGSRYEMMDGRHNIAVPEEKFLGRWSNGISLPKETFDGLKKRSEERQKSPNARYCAASGDLEDIENTLVTHFKSMPVNLPTRRKLFKENKRTSQNRVDPTELHPNIKPVVPRVESAIDSLGDEDPTRYHKQLDKLYIEASHVAHDQKTIGTDESPHYDAFHEAYGELLKSVGRFHGQEKRKVVAEALSGLPKPKKPKEAVPDWFAETEKGSSNV